jgi:hypothetical protein
MQPSGFSNGRLQTVFIYLVPLLGRQKRAIIPAFIFRPFPKPIPFSHSPLPYLSCGILWERLLWVRARRFLSLHFNGHSGEWLSNSPPIATSRVRLRYSEVIIDHSILHRLHPTFYSLFYCTFFAFAVLFYPFLPPKLSLRHQPTALRKIATNPTHFISMILDGKSLISFSFPFACVLFAHPPSYFFYCPLLSQPVHSLTRVSLFVL